MARELTPKLAVILRHLVKGNIFPACWRLANVVPVPKESPSSDVGDYRPISIIPPSVKGILEDRAYEVQ